MGKKWQKGAELRNATFKVLGIEALPLATFFIHLECKSERHSHKKSQLIYLAIKLSRNNSRFY